MIKKWWIKEFVSVFLLAMLLIYEKPIEQFGFKIFNESSNSVQWNSLTTLFVSHLQLVVLSTLLAVSLAFIISFTLHLLNMKALESLFISGANFGTSFPSVAVIALLVPSLGYGFKPVFIALVLYSFLPVFLSTLEGLKNIDPNIVIAAKGCGLSDIQTLFMVELPLARQMILSGVKTSIILNIATAAIGSVVGANSLGLPILAGIRTDNLVLILKGALPVALMALFVESIFSRMEGKQKWQIH